MSLVARHRAGVASMVGLEGSPATAERIRAYERERVAAARPVAGDVPMNAVTGAAYRGKNVDRLLEAEEAGGFGSGGWAGFRQWLSVGRVVRKGERGTACVTVIGRNGVESETARAVTDSREAAGNGNRKGGGVRGFRVFHFDQTCELGTVDQVLDSAADLGEDREVSS